MTFIVYRDMAGEFRWKLVARNGRKVANSGEGYVSRSGAKRAIRAIQKAMLIKGVPVIDQ